MPHWFEKDGTIDYNARGEFQSSDFTDGNSDEGAIKSDAENISVKNVIGKTKNEKNGDKEKWQK